MTNRLNFNLGDQSGWISFAKAQKEIFLELSEIGWMPPIVVGEKEGKLVLAVAAPQIDKHQGLGALQMLRRGFNIDACTFTTDAFVVRDREELANKYINKPGSMQKAFEEGSDEVVECISCVRYNSDGKIEMHSLTYAVADKKIDWLDEMSMSEDDEHATIGGFIPGTIRQIMTETQFALESPHLKDAAKFLGLEDNREKQEFHVRRATRTALMQNDFLVMECVEIDPNSTQEEMTEQLKAIINETRNLDPDRAHNLWGLTKRMSGDGGDEVQQTPFHNPFL